MSADDTQTPDPTAALAEARNAVMDEARVRLGMTWNEVAELAEISPQALRNIRSGESAARFATLRALEKALQLPAGALSGRYLLGGSRPNEKTETKYMSILTGTTDPGEHRDNRFARMAFSSAGSRAQKFLLVPLPANAKLSDAEADQLNTMLQALADSYIESRTRR